MFLVLYSIVLTKFLRYPNNNHSLSFFFYYLILTIPLSYFFVLSQEQYEFCYTTLQEYLDSFDLYANFQ